MNSLFMPEYKSVDSDSFLPLDEVHPHPPPPFHSLPTILVMFFLQPESLPGESL